MATNCEQFNAIFITYICHITFFYGRIVLKKRSLLPWN